MSKKVKKPSTAVVTQLAKKAVSAAVSDTLTLVRCPKCDAKYVQEHSPDGCPEQCDKNVN